MSGEICFMCGEPITDTQSGINSNGKDYHTATQIPDPFGKCPLKMSCFLWMQRECEIELRFQQAIAATAAPDAAADPEAMTVDGMGNRFKMALTEEQKAQQLDNYFAPFVNNLERSSFCPPKPVELPEHDGRAGFHDLNANMPIEEFLSLLYMPHLLGQLNEMGANSTNDVINLKSEDIDQLGLKVLPHRRFNRALQAMRDKRSSSPAATATPRS